MDNILFEKLIYENTDKFYQLRLTISEFRNEYYINIRKYFQSYEGEYLPSKEGISMIASLHNILSLTDGLMQICAKEENTRLIYEHFKPILDQYEKDNSDPKPFPLDDAQRL